MGNKELTNKVIELKELEQFAAEINAEMETIRDEIKAEMTAQGKDEITAGVFTIRWKVVVSKRFDSKLFKQDHGDMYEAYKRPSSSKRFTIS